MFNRILGLPLAIWLLGALGGIVALVCFSAKLTYDDVPRSDTPLAFPAAPVIGTPDPAPTVEPSCNSASRISWADASRFLNRYVAMIGPINQVAKDNQGVHLMVGTGPISEPVEVMIPTTALPLFLGAPEQVFANKTVCVLGVVQRVDGHMQVVINRPGELSVM